MDRRRANGNTSRTLRRSVAAKAVSPFVGRVDELRRLSKAIDLAAEGQGSVIFLTGQPGIGKTRLAREALSLAKARGFTTLEGHAHSLESELSYAPLVEAFEPLLRSPSVEAHGLDPTSLKALVSDLPSLGRLFEGLSLPPPPFPLETLSDPGLEKTRLFEAMSRLLERLTRSAPVALFVDDLQWADPATLELLYYLVRGLADQRLLLIASYSTDALDSARGLRALVGSLRRDGLAEEILIPPLGREAVDEMVRAILGGEAPSDLLALLDARAGGTPLFIEALIDALIDSAHLACSVHGWVLDSRGAADLPPSVRHLIVERLERLEPTDRRVVELIAVIGDATTHSILRAASGLGEEDLIQSLRRLMAAGLVAEGMEGLDSAYSITHPLVQEVAYDELPGAARRRSHVAAIGALESFHAKDDANRLARHYRGAGAEADPARALEVLLEAGERAWAIYANEEAARHYVAALAVLRGGEGSGVGGQGRGLPTSYSLSSLLERLGDVWERIGKNEAALEAWNEALVLLSVSEQAGDRVAASRLHNRLAGAEANRCDYDKSKAHVVSGLALLTEGPAGRRSCKELADLYVTRCYVFGRLGDLAGRAESIADLLSVAEGLASPLVQAQAHLLAFTVGLDLSEAVDARERAQHALKVAEQANDLAICYQAHSVLVVIAVRLGEHRLIRHHAARGLALAQRLGAPSYKVLPRLRLAYADFLSGAWDESLLSVIEAVGLARRVGNRRDVARALVERGILLALRGELSEAEGCISEARLAFGSRKPEDRYLFGLVDIAEMALALERGEAKRALDIARGFVRPSALLAAPSELTWLSMPTGLMLLAEAQVAAGEPESALEAAGRLWNLGPRGTPYLVALASRAEGLARGALGQRAEAMACLGRAYETFASLEMPFEAARSLLEQATLVGAERPELSAGIARQCLAMFETLGARRHAGSARQLLRGLGISPSDVLPWKDQPHLRKGLLSHRELEVARLVAEGLTTAEIARRLALSRSTVNTHLDHIYRRLQIGSRSALTRYVIEAGLLSPMHEGL